MPSATTGCEHHPTTPCDRCAELARVRVAMALRNYRRMPLPQLKRLLESTRARVPLMRKVIRERES
jgi:hypothetical protein